MKKTSGCRAVQHLLVDYADDAVGAADSAIVRRHVENCGACRTEVAALRRSLTLAESVWQESAATVRAVPSDRRAMAKRRLWRRAPLPWAACGAAAAVVLLLCWKTVVSHPSPTVARQTPHAEGGPLSDNAMADPVHSSNLEEIEDADIEAFIQREEQAARLATSIRILADAPNVHEDVARANGYLRKVYGVALSNRLRDENRDSNPLQQGI